MINRYNQSVKSIQIFFHSDITLISPEERSQELLERSIIHLKQFLFKKSFK